MKYIYAVVVVDAKNFTTTIDSYFKNYDNAVQKASEIKRSYHNDFITTEVHKLELLDGDDTIEDTEYMIGADYNDR